MTTCPQCHTENPTTARFCMNCGSFLPLAEQQSRQIPDVSPSPPPTSFVPPSEAARQTGGLAPATSDGGYLRYARPTGQTDQLTVTPPSGYVAPAAGPPRYTAPIPPPATAPQSQAAMWMSDSANSGYYYPPATASKPATRQSNFGLYMSVALVALIVVAGAAAFLLWGLPGSAANSTQGNTKTAPGATTPAAPQAGGSAVGAIQSCKGTQDECNAVKAAIDGSNQDQIDSLKTLKTDSLKNNTTGSELSNHIQDVMDLQSKGYYYDTKLEHIDYQEVTIVSANEATAKTVESWSGKLYDQKSNQLLGSQPATTLHETYHFVKQNGKWLVDKVTIAEEQNGQPTPPDNSQ